MSVAACARPARVAAGGGNFPAPAAVFLGGAGGRGAARAGRAGEGGRAGDGVRVELRVREIAVERELRGRARDEEVAREGAAVPEIDLVIVAAEDDGREALCRAADEAAGGVGDDRARLCGYA